MDFLLTDATPVLQRTPGALRALLGGLSGAWGHANEGPGTWSPAEIVGHLVHGERTDWIPRVEHILRHGDAVPFPRFDREAMLREAGRPPLEALLETFGELRRISLGRLEALALTDGDLDRRGLHPDLGEVTLRQHLATWTAHDLSHVGQVVRVMSRQYRDDVGPWKAYLPILGT
jgi:hypothetical protein